MWRRIEIKEDKAVDNAVKGKDTFFLPTGHAISNMILTVRAKNESDHNAPDATEAKTVINAISNIKIEAGSRVFKDYSAEIALKWATYRNGSEPHTDLTQALGGTYNAGSNQTVAGLKLLLVSATMVTCLRSNQTVAGLKPRWYSLLLYSLEGSNQTVAGLKRER